MMCKEKKRNIIGSVTGRWMISLATVMTVLGIMTIVMFPGMVQAAEEPAEGKKDIVIEVVEDIPVTEIEEEEVPLAAPVSAAETRSGAVYVIPVAILAAAGVTLWRGHRRRKAEIALLQGKRAD